MACCSGGGGGGGGAAVGGSCSCGSRHCSSVGGGTSSRRRSRSVSSKAKSSTPKQLGSPGIPDAPAKDAVEKAMITSEMITAGGDDMDEVRQATE